MKVIRLGIFVNQVIPEIGNWFQRMHNNHLDHKADSIHCQSSQAYFK